MCNLYTMQEHNPKAIGRAFDVTADLPFVDGDGKHWPQRPGLIIRPRPDNGAGREAEAFRWGLVPFWADDPKVGRTMTNARSETVRTKPAFRAAYKARRCLIPATGFCEWRAKVWYEFTLPDRPLFAMAGLWETWDKGDAPLETFTMLTTESNELVSEYHAKQRMPVILEPDDYDLWLLGTPDQAFDLLRTYPADRMAVAPLD